MNQGFKNISLYCFVAFALIFLFTASPSEAQRRGRGVFSSSSNESIFEGIEDELVLPMLRYLPRQYGGQNVTPADGRFLYDLILEKGYTSALEVGTSNGYSGLWIGLALKQNNGKLVTIEIDHRAADEARRNFKRAGLDGVVEVMTADALVGIPRVPGTFDFVFIDGHKPEYKGYYDLIRHRMRPGGAITAHNVTGRDRSMADFVEAIQTDPKLETVIYPRHAISVSIVKP